MQRNRYVLVTFVYTRSMTQLLDHTLLSAHDARSGRLDALKLAHTLALSTPQMARIMGYTSAGLRKNPSSERLQSKLQALVELTQRLKAVFGGDLSYALIWLRAPHPDLEGKTPLSCLEAGHGDAVELLVYAMETGQPL